MLRAVYVLWFCNHLRDDIHMERQWDARSLCKSYLLKYDKNLRICHRD